ncbi:MAG: MBL fold metallo-hydrolase [Candidatus Abyssobacteria bacterium SURF_5]|uniref:MBL fold metallo-hydrolase n=1 Tax=Abyssobacteria bacterium (strain SURF_5) TaxID=2093360 RepID=A0A3A4NAA3_ABYX5|nr:MAG: MBL fold metallo-hydrolase [Candidatus Abyssubacteria bacterium SURF_5]
MKIFAVGHSTFKLELNGQVIFTDPWFGTSGFVNRLFARRIFPVGVRAKSIERCDLMLVSHGHIDHVCQEAFAVARRLNSLVIGPPGIILRARRARVPHVHDLSPGGVIKRGDITITGVPAVHPLSRNALGYLLEGERSIYFSGDTRFDWGIVEFLKDRAIDVAILQVSCAFYPWLNGADGMDVNYAEELAKAIRPKYVIPMHFDCAGKYVDLIAGKRVTEYDLELENSLERFRRRLLSHGIGCGILYSGQTVNL